MMTTVTVLSERTAYFYDVTVLGGPVACTCPDFTYRQRICKHMRLVAEVQFR